MRAMFNFAAGRPGSLCGVQVNSTCRTSGVSTLTRMTSEELAGIAEVAAMFGVSRQTAHKYVRHARFPEPLDRLASGAVWRRRDVEAWDRENRPLRPGRPARERREPPTAGEEWLNEQVGDALAVLNELLQQDVDRNTPLRQDRLMFAVALLGLHGVLDLEKRVAALERRHDATGDSPSP